jgi:hypothetical protein
VRCSADTNCHFTPAYSTVCPFARLAVREVVDDVVALGAEAGIETVVRAAGFQLGMTTPLNREDCDQSGTEEFRQSLST